MEKLEKDALEALKRLAEGYEYEEREIIVDKHGKSTGRVKVTKKHMPPNITAIRELLFMPKE